MTGVQDTRTPAPEMRSSEIDASSPPSAVGHTHSEITDWANPTPTREEGSAGSAPAGSVGSAPSIVVTVTTKHKVRQGDDVTEDARQGVRLMDTEGRQGNIAVTEKYEKGNIITAKNKKDVHGNE